MAFETIQDSSNSAVSCFSDQTNWNMNFPLFNFIAFYIWYILTTLVEILSEKQRVANSLLQFQLNIICPHDLWRKEKCSSLAPPRGSFYKTQLFSYTGCQINPINMNFHIHTSLEFFYKNSADKTKSKKY